MKGLDLRNFKKIASDEHSTTLQHPEGHKIVISHKKLGKDMRASLEALPHMDSGGTAPQPPPPDEITQSMRKAFHFDDGGSPQDKDKKADTTWGAMSSKPLPNPSPPPVTDDETKEMFKKAFHFNQGGQMGEDAALKENYQADNFKRAKKRGEGLIQHQMRMAHGGTANPKLQQSHVRNYDKGGKVDVRGEEVPVSASKLESQYLPEEQAAQDIVAQDPQAQIQQEADSQPDMRQSILDSHNKLIDAHSKIVNAATAQPTEQPQQPQTPVQSTTPQLGATVQDTVPNSNAPLAQQAEQDVNKENQAQTAMGQNVSAGEAQKADIYGNKAQQMMDLQKKYEEYGNQIHHKFEELSDQVENGHIDPHHWWSSKSTGSQIMTAIGMMLGGAGVGAGGHPELASQAINKAIDRDIDSQKSDLQNKNTLLGKYMEMYNSLPQAEQAARLTMEAGVEGLINQQASKVASPNAINAATMANAQRRQQLLPQLEGLAKGQVMAQMYSGMGNPSQGAQAGGAEAAYQKQLSDLAILNPERYKIEQAKYLPGVGTAAKPMPDKVVEEMTARKDLSDKLAELENFSREHSGTVLDRKIVNQGAALARGVQDAYRRGNAQGVFREAEKDFVEKSIATDPTALFAKYRTIPGYQEARKMNNDTIEHYKKAYGVKSFNQSQGSSDSNQTATMNGVQYRKVPGGWQKVD